MGTGWTWLKGALANNDVHLFTEPTAPVDSIREASRGLPGTLSITVVPLGPFGRFYGDSRLRLLRYLAWVVNTGRLARSRATTERADALHHVTMVGDWLPSPGSWVTGPIPFVWGPVGGASYAPWRVVARLGVRSTAVEALRFVGTRTARRLWVGGTMRAATVVVALNDDTKSELTRLYPSEGDKIVIDAAVFLDFAPRPQQPHSGGQRIAVYAGRLVPYKALEFAIRAMQHATEWQLHIYGGGLSHPRLERLARQLRLEHRVHFRGVVPRERLLDDLCSADAFILPSLHDSWSWAAAEAAALGLPVICFPIGGPPSTAGPAAVLVPLEGDVVLGLANALRNLPLVSRVDPDWARRRWSPDRVPDLLERWYASSSRQA